MDQLAAENKVLVEFKLVDNLSDMPALILKYGDPEMAQLGDVNGRSQYLSGPKYRTPSQARRDNHRVKTYCGGEQYYASASDSGVFNIAGQGAFSSTPAVPGKHYYSGFRPETTKSAGLLETMHSLTLSHDDRHNAASPDQLFDKDTVDYVQDSVEKVDAETSYDVIDVVDIGLQCGDSKPNLVDAETQYDAGEFMPSVMDVGVQCTAEQCVMKARGIQCGAGVNEQRSVGINCYVRVKGNSKRTQTKDTEVHNIGVNCCKESKEHGVQTLNKQLVKTMNQATVACQASPKTVGRHTQANPVTNDAKIQTKAPKPVVVLGSPIDTRGLSLIQRIQRFHPP
jgi:hypothetical protein